MALESKDRVRDQSTTTGTGTLTIAGVAPTGYRTFGAGHSTGATVQFTTIMTDFTEWEVCQGVWTAAGSTLTRVTVFASSNAGALVNFSAGTKTVFSGPTSGYLTGIVPRLAGYTVGTLPAGVQGDKVFVTDALAPAYLVTVVAGGSAVTEVFYNGTNWVCT